MLARSGPLPSGTGWSYELKWDGFRAIVSTEDGLRVRSRRGWNNARSHPPRYGEVGQQKTSIRMPSGSKAKNA
jgi:bifunctional non-homologous end joining protein LigD